MSNFVINLGILIVLITLYIVLIKATIKQIKRRREAALNSILETPHVINLSIEVIGNMVYFFDKETNEFLAQGTNNNEIFQHLAIEYKARFGNQPIRVNITNDEISKLQTIDGFFDQELDIEFFKKKEK